MRLRASRAVVVPAGIAVAVAGCASAEQIHAHFEPVRAKVREEAQAVASRVTPQHLERCRKLLEGSDLLGTTYRTAGDFHLNLKMSCHAQGLDMGMEFFPRDYKVAVYEIANEKVSAGLNLRGGVTACEVRLLANGDITVTSGAMNTKGPGNSACHHI